MIDLDSIELRWFDYWLKGINNGIIDEAPIDIFVMGINKWRSENEWPLKRTKYQNWNLHSNGDANSIMGNGTLSKEKHTKEKPDIFNYDPRFPVQTV